MKAVFRSTNVFINFTNEEGDRLRYKSNFIGQKTELHLQQMNTLLCKVSSIQAIHGMAFVSNKYFT